jgi:hypothetical protein
MRRHATALILLCGTGCIGNIGEGGPSTLSEQVANEVGASGMRRLSVDEYQRSVTDLLGVTAEDVRELLPVDTLSPFDNNYTLQTPSEALIKGAELVAGDIADGVAADTVLRSKIVGCEPASVDDASCFRSFVTKFGRRALRRPLSTAEVDVFMGLLEHAVAANDFWVAVNAALRAFLQHPQFLYRVEVGEPVAGRPGLFKLNNHQIGARLSYLLIGSTPPDWLLDAADAGQLSEPVGVTAAAAKLLGDPRARARLNRFHAMWLSYAQLPATGISGDMHAETNALLERVIFEERRPWVDVLTASETFLTPALAEHYGLPSPGAEAGWVDYADSGRKGFFSHGTFLSAVSKFGDTSPTQRGLLIRTRLFCQTIEKPPPNLDVNVDEPPTVADPNACKKDRYFMSHEDACKSCHALMDPIGFGLENYGADGGYRATEPDRPDCPIDGEGDFAGTGTFNGPSGLSDLAVASGFVEACVVKQLYRFAIGRTELDQYDDALVDRLATESSADGMRLFDFITRYVTSEAFRYRRDEEVSP